MPEPRSSHAETPGGISTSTRVVGGRPSCSRATSRKSACMAERAAAARSERAGPHGWSAISRRPAESSAAAQGGGEPRGRCTAVAGVAGLGPGSGPGGVAMGYMGVRWEGRGRAGEGAAGSARPPRKASASSGSSRLRAARWGQRLRRHGAHQHQAWGAARCHACRRRLASPPQGLHDGLRRRQLPADREGELGEGGEDAGAGEPGERGEGRACDAPSRRPPRARRRLPSPHDFARFFVLVPKLKAGRIRAALAAPACEQRPRPRSLARPRRASLRPGTPPTGIETRSQQMWVSHRARGGLKEARSGLGKCAP